MSNLPDNCTKADIDRAFGFVATCCECHRVFPVCEEIHGEWTCRRCSMHRADDDD